MNWTCKIDKEAFNSGSGTYIKECELATELDIRLNRVSGPNDLWLVKDMRDKRYISLIFQCTPYVCDTLERFNELLEADIIPILKSLVVNGKKLDYDVEHGIQDAWLDRSRWEFRDFVEPVGFMPV